MTYVTSGYVVRRIEMAKKPNDEPDARAHEYLAKFRALESHFFEYIHPQVDGGLIADGLRSVKDDELPNVMTIHGSRHIRDVVESIDKIGLSIEEKPRATPLNSLEAYILLCATHLHDAGNIGGRAAHPERSGEIIHEHPDLFYDTETRHNIFDVARVHGGKSPQFGRDTFRGINSDNFTFPRLRLLAAILRIADELSENSERVPAELIKRLAASPKSNLAYRYAQCFRRFELQNDTLDVLLRVQPDQHEFVTEIDGECLNFFDHLEHKIDVIEKEARYCAQYGRPDFDIRRIRFTVEFFADRFPSVSRKVSLALHLDRGYPDELPVLSARCDDLANGASLAEFCRG